MSRHHPEVKIMRAPFTGTWYAVRERDGVVTDKWPIDIESSRQLDDMRTRHANAIEAEAWAVQPAIASDQPAYRAGYWQAQYEVRQIFGVESVPERESSGNE